MRSVTVGTSTSALRTTSASSAALIGLSSRLSCASNSSRIRVSTVSGSLRVTTTSGFLLFAMLPGRSAWCPAARGRNRPILKAALTAATETRELAEHGNSDPAPLYQMAGLETKRRSGVGREWRDGGNQLIAWCFRRNAGALRRRGGGGRAGPARNQRIAAAALRQ